LAISDSEDSDNEKKVVEYTPQEKKKVILKVQIPSHTVFTSHEDILEVQEDESTKYNPNDSPYSTEDKGSVSPSPVRKLEIKLKSAMKTKSIKPLIVNFENDKMINLIKPTINVKPNT
jgi:hypothetical protein